MKHKSNLGLLKIQGLIIPVTWDEEGNPLSVAVATFDENKYLVEEDAKGDQLIGLLREEVEVSGVVGIKDGVKTIKVRSYVLDKKSAFNEGALEKEREVHGKGKSVPRQ